MRYFQNYSAKKKILKISLFLSLILSFTTFSQEQLTAPVDSISTIKKGQPDSTTKEQTADSLISIGRSDVSRDSTAEKPTAKLNKRNYNHREQIIFGAVMMAFVAIILTTVQSMNPD